MKHIISTALSALLIVTTSFTSAVHAHPSWKGDAKGGKDVSALAKAKKKDKGKWKEARESRYEKQEESELKKAEKILNILNQ